VKRRRFRRRGSMQWCYRGHAEKLGEGLVSVKYFAT
jgi:hypothetical protein